MQAKFKFQVQCGYKKESRRNFCIINNLSNVEKSALCRTIKPNETNISLNCRPKLNATL